jgi:hypothetical protein
MTSETTGDTLQHPRREQVLAYCDIHSNNNVSAEHQDLYLQEKGVSSNTKETVHMFKQVVYRDDT